MSHCSRRLWESFEQIGAGPRYLDSHPATSLLVLYGREKLRQECGEQTRTCKLYLETTTATDCTLKSRLEVAMLRISSCFKNSRSSLLGNSGDIIYSIDDNLDE